MMPAEGATKPVAPAVRWFREIWPRKASRDATIADYQSAGRLKHFLTDVALRGFVFTPHPRPAGGGVDLFEAGRREGRRELALEIIRTAGENPGDLYRFVERAGSGVE
jgi:hypothetical protein